MAKIKPSTFSLFIALLLLAAPISALAQTPQPTQSPTPSVPTLTFYTPYPSQVYGIGETISVDVHLLLTNESQVIALATKDVPTGWTATFQGGGRTIQSVYLTAGVDTTIQLRLTAPADVKAGTFNFSATATGSNLNASLSLQIILQEKLPPKLGLTVDLPTVTGSPTSTFTYNVTLKNLGDEDLTVNLSSNSNNQFQVTVSYNGQTVTSLPMAANDSKTLSVTATPLGNIQGGSYPIQLQANGGSAQASLDLTAQVTGQVTLAITSPDGTLSGQVNSGTTTALNLVVQNTGSAPANRIALTATSPSGWTVTFSPTEIPQLGANQQQQVTMNVQPASDSVSGDYMLTINAQPASNTSKSVDFRVTLLTSSLWGIVGVVLIAIAVGVVALAVVRFGRR
jgi:uncharacterized membrane protein